MQNKKEKKVRSKKCKICGADFVPFQMGQVCCGISCAVKLARISSERDRAKKQKAREKAERAKIKQVRESLKSRSQWLNDLQKVFNRFIRLRDQNEPCISCGRFHQGQWHAGHYRSVGACPELRFNEDNVHRQCSVCNNYKSGNVVDYRLNLVRKIGEERVAFLERDDHEPLKLSVEDIKALMKVYKAKCKELS